jgi:tetratricopeptide (TPR) repeat protein
VNKSSKQQADWRKCMNLGMHSFQKGRPREAVASFRKAVAIMPGRHESWINLGSALLESGQLESAADAFHEAIAISPNTMLAHMMLGDAMRLQGKTARSIDSYQRAVALERAPAALNKLACALRARARVDEAEELYYEAERKDPTFSLARVNRATMQIERRRYDEARRQLALLEKQALPPQEKREVLAARNSLHEHARLNAAIDAMAEHGDLAALAARLAETPSSQLQVDRAALGTVEAYASYIRGVDKPHSMQVIALPEEWPLIEAMHMIPLVHSVAEYLSVRDNSASAGKPALDIQESVNMEPAIRAARQCRDDMLDPVKAEVHLRHWHALAANGIEGFMPGHFKYTQNWAPRSPTLPRVNPGMCSGTMRYLISHIYNRSPPGLLRATVAFLGLFDPHPFADGNARIAFIWLNRELEWAGLMPALFSKSLGLKGELGAALVQVRESESGVAPLLAVINKAQQHARDFCIEFTRLC